MRTQVSTEPSPAGYPPEPWALRGVGYLALWLVPANKLPALPDRVRPLRIAGRTIVSTAFVDYQPTGQLSYRELLVAVLVRSGLTIPQIWVDSPASLAGGRELWGIPKNLAELRVEHGRAEARLNGQPFAQLRSRPARAGLRLPFPLRATALQTLGESLARTPLTATGRVAPVLTSWRFGGELSWLDGHRPVFGAVAGDFGLTFGPRRT